MRRLLVAVLLCCLACSCDRAGQALSRVGGAEARLARQWFEQRWQGAVPFEGPAAPELLWKYYDADFDIVGIYPTLSGDTYLCGSVMSPADDSRRPSEQLKQREAIGQRSWIVRLDGEGREIGRVELPKAPDGRHWHVSSFSCQQGPKPRVVAVCSQGGVGAQQAALEKMTDDESVTVQGIYRTHVYSFDADLRQEWSAELPDRYAGALDDLALLQPDGELVLLVTRMWSKGLPLEFTPELRWYSAAGQAAGHLEIPQPKDQPGEHDLALANGHITNSELIVSGGRIYFALRKDTIYCIGPNRTVEWQTSLGHEIPCQPLALPGGGVVLPAESYKLTWDLRVDMKGHQPWDPHTLHTFASTGVPGWSAEIPGLFFWALAADTEGAIYAVIADSDGKDLAVSDALTSRYPKLHAGGNPPPVDIPRDFTMHLRKLGPRGSTVWDYAWEERTSNTSRNPRPPIVDAAGSLYLWIEEELIAVDSAGSERFRLDLGPLDGMPYFLGRGLLIGPGGRLYMQTDVNRLLVLGDK